MLLSTYLTAVYATLSTIQTPLNSLHCTVTSYPTNHFNV